ncbi:chemotaxis protein CheX [Nocardioides sp. J2M5]|uniref:chemotaxis protein CheX n=1 Tax=Nocardioides palaemonis TaxID=2829810 RepID=UPI001BAB9942|nr:chemotaxis protein CheX [Nocardioides palaemonis]MBS2940172.1 chemotaxis protein CheX [Nocardioides palaemonis]
MSSYVQESPVTPDDLHLLGEEVLTAFLLQDAPPASSPEQEETGRLRASVAVHGQWTGWITLEVSRAAARDLTRRMLSDPEVSEEDVRDAVGELVNVLGGNVKSLLVDGSTLGLPEVLDADAGDWPHVEICQALLWWAGHPVEVRVWGVDPDRPEL